MNTTLIFLGILIFLGLCVYALWVIINKVDDEYEDPSWENHIYNQHEDV